MIVRKTKAERPVRFKGRVREWAAKLRVEPREIRVQRMKRKWASCSAAWRVTFDESVPALSIELQDYVIVHELLHIRVPNHGKLWKSLMRAHLGNYEALELRLKRHAT